MIGHIFEINFSIFKVEKSGDQSKFVLRLKSRKNFQLFHRSPLFQSIKFLQLHYSQLYYLIKDTLKAFDDFKNKQESV